jgi:hypothetical protein
VNPLRRFLDWLMPEEDRVSPATLRRLRAQLDAQERLPAVGTADVWPKPAPKPEPEAPEQRRVHTAYKEPAV